MSEWIKVTERLPPKNTTVLGLTRRKKIKVTRYVERFGWHWGVKTIGQPDYMCDDPTYTHWMLLPEPPK